MPSLRRPAVLDDALLAGLAREHGTPLWVYDGDVVRERLARLAGFDRVRYAIKANPNLALLALLRRAGAAADAVSEGELRRALLAGFAPAELCLTADLFERGALALVAERGIPVNLGSADMIEAYARAAGSGRGVTLRLNPGFGGGHHRGVETGGRDAKHGIWHAELAQAAERARACGLAVEGLHVHVGSGIDLALAERTAQALVAAAARAGPALERISCGGGLPVPYVQRGDGGPGAAAAAPFDVAAHARLWRAARDEVARVAGRPIELEVEPGRYLVAEAGVLLAEVCAVKRSGGHEIALLDAGFNDLVRPAFYGARHGLRVLGREPGTPTRPVLVAGPLCESSDVFSRGPDGLPAPADLPPLARGDLIALETAGAYGASMSSGYNSRPLAAEVLVEDGSARLVRRRQTWAELLAAELSEAHPEGPDSSWAQPHSLFTVD